MRTISGKEILIVDDDNDIRNVLSGFFSSNGCAVSIAKDGDEALKTLKEKSFGLLITDFNMPVMNGIELIRAVRNIDTTLTIIGMSLGEKESEFLKAGADYFLSKPFDFRSLKSILNFVFRE